MTRMKDAAYLEIGAWMKIFEARHKVEQLARADMPRRKKQRLVRKMQHRARRTIAQERSKHTEFQRLVFSRRVHNKQPHELVDLAHGERRMLRVVRPGTHLKMQHEGKWLWLRAKQVQRRSGLVLIEAVGAGGTKVKAWADGSGRSGLILEKDIAPDMAASSSLANDMRRWKDVFSLRKSGGRQRRYGLVEVSDGLWSAYQARKLGEQVPDVDGAGMQEVFDLLHPVAFRIDDERRTVWVKCDNSAFDVNVSGEEIPLYEVSIQVSTAEHDAVPLVGEGWRVVGSFDDPATGRNWKVSCRKSKAKLPPSAR